VLQQQLSDPGNRALEVTDKPFRAATMASFVAEIGQSGVCLEPPRGGLSSERRSGERDHPILFKWLKSSLTEFSEIYDPASYQ
jgi:hypothetical protein